MDLQPSRVGLPKSPEFQGITQDAFAGVGNSCTPVPGSEGQFIIIDGGTDLPDTPRPWINETYLLCVAEKSLTPLETRGDKPNERHTHRAAIFGRVLVLFGGDFDDDYLHFLHLGKFFSS